MKFILASKSPRRKELLNQIGLPFEVIVSDIDEACDKSLSAYEQAKIISLKKAKHILDTHHFNEDTVIIGADTIVCLNDEIMGKPTSSDDAYSMLKKLQGREHTVFTGLSVIIIRGGIAVTETIVSSAVVTLKPLSDDGIKQYIKTGEPFDKAGSYAIQEKASVFVQNISGDYFTIVGLPLSSLYEILSKHNINIINYWNDEYE